MASRKEISIKELSIDLLDIAHINFLANLQGIIPEDVEVSAHSDINSIKFIVQHCSGQMDRTIGSYTGQRVMKDNFEYSFREIVDMYLQISQTFFTMLEDFTVDDFYNNPEGTGEILYKKIERIALHYLGHTGQIVIIRKMLGRGIAGAYGFVKAMSKPTRSKLKKEWSEWWEESREKFS